MNKTVYCLKLERELPALAEPPLPGKLGTIIQENISADAWNMFLHYFKGICCAQYLDLTDPATDRIFYEALNFYLFRNEPEIKEMINKQKPGK
ncbi:MAG: Fe(2+)-trafficking protein [bacterium]|nr:Fe(2+)-trafficking protein [bacterium]